MNRQPIYLDYNATTPCDPRVVEAMLPFFTSEFGNAASRDHAYGWLASDRVEEAREEAAMLIGAGRTGRIVFTSGATESINLALKGLAEGFAGRGNHIITCKTEHRAVLDTCGYLEGRGYRISYLDVNGSGEILPDAVEAAICPQTIGIAIMYANNETGVIHPVRAIGAIARRHGIPFFCDATQAVGKIPVDVAADHIDMLAFSAHKLYGPKGVGVLYAGVPAAGGDGKQGLCLQQHGGHHEGGLRSGTLNVPGIVGLGTAAALCRKEMRAEGDRLRALRDRFEQLLSDSLGGLVVNGGGARLPHVSNFLLPQGDAEQVLLTLSPFLAASRGSACSGLVQQASYVLRAMGVADSDASRAVRVSIGRFTTMEEVEEATRLVTEAVSKTPACV